MSGFDDGGGLDGLGGWCEWQRCLILSMNNELC